MVDTLDDIARFAKTKNFHIKPYTIFVEGTTDVELFELAAKLEKEKTGLDLLGDRLTIVAAGEGDFGGVTGVVRELITFKNMSSWCLLPNGRPKYRFVGLFDNDRAGRQAVKDVHRYDTSILEYKSVYRLWPVMPLSSNLDPDALQKSFESENAKYSGLDWELEDLLPDSFINVFLCEFPTAVARPMTVHDKVHRNWTSDGKARLHHFVKQNAIHKDLVAVIDVVRALSHYLNIKHSLPNLIDKP